MAKTVLNYPVQIVAISPEPTLLELIAHYYDDHLPRNEALAASLEYIKQIKLAEAFLKVDFAKYILSKIDFPEGVDVQELIRGAAEKVRGEQAAEAVLSELADEKRAAKFEDDANANHEQSVTFDDPNVTVMLFTDGTAMEAYLAKIVASRSK